ncbi:uncharacterized protein STEHIDRAFT_156299 [Stereum hirsutum FP-91666 SS1]|uniref:uncharacterized protein n=1 Tax=Stereum hirsutum (strain FP-91666) TaxID=721885 RepID=UPI000440EBA4|nr:uncharacterized protein STEHIDRAFT_156299 [Stereum hirsutum FP-91666 SS1]EIM87316.1 hypothetical protein STEHIDRAFT_156299 [Stereum hirsutum FP-91666 SS1]
MSSTTPPTPTSPSTQTLLKTAADPPFNSPDADIIIRSSDDWDFRVHRSILRLGSVAFKEMFAAQPQLALPSTGTDSNSTDDYKDGLPIVRLTETSNTLRILLGLLYPGDSPEIAGRANTIAVVEAVHKYMVESYPKTITAALLSLSKSAPHAVLALVFRHGLALDIRQAAALSTLKLPAVLQPNRLPDAELELLTASQFRRILLYHQQCTVAASAAVKRMDWVGLDWAEVSCGVETRGGNQYWVKQPDDCICIRTPRLIGARSSNKSENDTRTVYLALWVIEFIDWCERRMTILPHWELLANAPILSTTKKTRECEFCGPKAEGELRELTAYLFKEVKQTIDEVKLPV